MNNKNRIFIMTYAPYHSLIPANLPALQTLRTGFPTANVTVVDNCSCSAAREIFRQLSTQHGYRYQELTTRTFHHIFQYDIVSQGHGKVIFIDPDVVFFENCEHLAVTQEALPIIRGRLIPAIFGTTRPPLGLPVARAHTPRVHPSFFVVLDCQLLTYMTEFNDWLCGGSLDTYPVKVEDTLCRLTEKMQPYIEPFTPDELDCFHHLGGAGWVTTHTADVTRGDPMYPPEYCNCVQNFQKLAVGPDGNYENLRGAWREHDALLERFSYNGEFIQINTGKVNSTSYAPAEWGLSEDAQFASRADWPSPVLALA